MWLVWVIYISLFNFIFSGTSSQFRISFIFFLNFESYSGPFSWLNLFLIISAFAICPNACSAPPTTCRWCSISYHRAGRYEVDGYVYNAAEEPKILMTGKWNESMSYQPCDLEGEPLPGTEMKEVAFIWLLILSYMLMKHLS